MTEVHRRRRGRSLALLAALAAFAAALLASAPAANAGIIGSNQVTVNLGGTGAGTVVQSSGPGNGTALAINCTKAAGAGQPSTGVCNARVPFGEPPQPWFGVTAQPSAGSAFAGWNVPAGVPIATGNYCGLNPTCIFQVNGPVNVQAVFNSAPGSPLVVFRQGSAGTQGSVTSNPAGIACTPTDQIDCTDAFPIGSTVTLTATAPAGVTFAGWSTTNNAVFNCAQGNASPVCTFPMPSFPAFVVATFNTQTFPLTVSVTGDGGVSSNVQPNGISCGSGNTACTANIASGTQVTLTATADTGFTFQGWGGACTGTATCTVTMSQAQSVSATFVASRIDASVAGNSVIYSQRNPRRVLQVRINAGEEVNVRIQLRRGGVNYASRRYQNVDEGRSVLRLRIPNSVPVGRYTAVITFTNDAGAPPLVVNRNVRLRAAP